MSRKIVLGLFAAFILAGSYCLHYVLPRYMVVEISGADSKRAEGIPTRAATAADTATDVYFIYIVKADGSSGILRNEDTGWGLPPYFKFNAADLQAKAQSQKGKQLQIGYYGWRNQLLGLFPNVLSIREAQSGDPQTSWTRNIVFTLWWALIIILFPRYYTLLMGLGSGASGSAAPAQESPTPKKRSLFGFMRREKKTGR